MSNIMFNDKFFNNETMTVDSTGVLTTKGVAIKTFGLLILATLSAGYTWYLAMNGFADKLMIMMIGGMIAAFICAMLAFFKPQYSKPLSLTYALCEGLVLGGISAAFGPIALEAVIATFLTVLAMLLLYTSRMVQATPKFAKVIATCIFSICLFYGFQILLALFHLPLAGVLSNIDNNIFVRLFITGVAAFSLIIDFDQIETFKANFLPRYFEWYCALSLMVTIVWIYVELLKTLGSRR